MSPNKNYLGAAVPETRGEKPREQSNDYDERIAGLEEQIAALVEQLTKQNRDSLDAEYNVGMDNLAEDLADTIRKLQSDLSALTARVTALEQ